MLLAAAVAASSCGGSGDATGTDKVADTTVPAEPSESPDEPDAPADTTVPDDPAAAPVDATSDTDVTAASDDGVLQVLVPAGAGPGDVTIGSIDVDAEALAEDGLLAVGYELGPDGATFTEPVTLTFELPASEWADGDATPLVLVASESEGSLLPTSIERDVETITVTVQVEHFSNYYVIKSSRGHLELTLAAETFVPALSSGYPAVRGRFDEGNGLILEEVLGHEWEIDEPPFTLLGTSTSGGFGGTSGSFPVVNAKVGCEDPGTSSQVTVDLDVRYSVAPSSFGATAGLFAADSLGDELPVTSHIRLDGSATCIGSVPPNDEVQYAEGEPGVPDFDGAYLERSSDGDLSIGFVLADPAASIDYLPVLILDGRTAAGEPLIVECGAAPDADCRGFAGNGYSPLDAEFTTSFVGSDGVLRFESLDITEADGTLVFDLVDATTDADLGPGPVELTGVSMSVIVQELGASAWYWEPADLQSTLLP